jgi:hypothetical protein
MQLSHGQSALIHKPSNSGSLFVDEHSDRRHKRRQSVNNPFCHRRFDETRALAIHDETERIGSRLNGHPRIFLVGDTADFDFHVDRIAFTK